MKTLIFIFVTIFSGAIAGTLLGLINQIIVEPYIDKAIGIQTQRAINGRAPASTGSGIHFSWK